MKLPVPSAAVGSALLVLSTLVLSTLVMPPPAGAAGPAAAAPAAGRVARAAPGRAAHPGATAQERRLQVVGHSAVGGGGFNAGVFGHRHFAYVGVFGGDPAAGTPCPASGVKVVDYRDPRTPKLVSVLPSPRLTSAEEVVVRSVRTRAFSGDLAVVGIQACGGRRRVFRGLALFDVTLPYRPRRLGRWAVPSPAGGCRGVDLVQRGDGRVLAGCAAPFAEQVRAGDEVNLVDATDPRRPVKAGGWRLGRDLGTDPRRGVGCYRAALADGVRFADRGRRVYASYWDAGTIDLDLRDPARPRFAGRTVVTPPDEDGDNHSVALGKDGKVLLVDSEDFSPLDCPGARRFGAWGRVHLYDGRDRDGTALLGNFSTANSRSRRTDGLYSVHETEVVRDTQAFSAWYSDGVVWWTLAKPRHPRLVGQFVPPAGRDPRGFFPAVPLVWGVHPVGDGKLVLASDVNTGLWILKPEGLGRP